MLRAPGHGGGGIPATPVPTYRSAGSPARGDPVLLDIGAANHDPAVFPGPDRFDVTRQGPHLSFGHGGHSCLRAPLARIELQTVFARLLPRFPEMRLAVPVEQLRVRSGALIGGLTKLPVEW